MVSVQAAQLQVGRAFRSEHARARPAYPRDPLGLRSTRHTRLGHHAVSPCVHRSTLLLLLAPPLQARGTGASIALVLQPFGASTRSWAARMPSRRDARDGAQNILRFSRTLERGRCSCACACVVPLAAIRWLLVARPMHVLASPMEPAHGLWRFGCVRAELRAMVCGMCGGSLALLNAAVRGARLLLAVVHGTQKCVGQIRAELWSSEDP